MAGIQYGAWKSQGTVAAQYAMLCLHISELNDSGIGVGDTNGDGQGRANFSAVVHMKNLLDQVEKYERALGIGLSASMVSRLEVRRSG